MANPKWSDIIGVKILDVSKIDDSSDSPEDGAAAYLLLDNGFLLMANDYGEIILWDKQDAQDLLNIEEKAKHGTTGS